MTQIDAKGKACPIPVILAKKETDRGNREFTVLVDNRTAVENLTRFGTSNGLTIDVQGAVPEFRVTFSDGACTEGCVVMERSPNSYAILVGKEGIGDGEGELGSNLLSMLFYTIAESKEIPSYILFMNAGVKVTVENQQAIGHLKTLESMGTELLVCGTCLNFYGITESLKVGIVSNMYTIFEAMNAVDKVITLP